MTIALSALEPAGPPTLVTDGYRSGTTFVGKMLTASREAADVHEPFDSAGGVR